jgi:beta-N-acetylhexosaminidase
VKDNQNLLPISPSKTPRIRLTVLGERESGTFGDNGTIGGLLKEELEKTGFQVSLYDYETLEHGEIFTSGVADLKKKFDLSMVAANVPTGSNNTSRRVDWVTLMAADEPWYTREIPTMFISFCNPYHMVDVPFISTFVNCYSSNPACVEEAVRKLTGQSPFRGKSPVDPWCGGIWGAKFM